MMTLEEARVLLEYEATEGLAYTSRYGAYPDRARMEEIKEALRTIHRELRGQAVIDRKLAAFLFAINDQVQGNMSGAEAKGIPISEEFSTEGFFDINGLLYAIFEDWEDTY
jgi:aminoglycoside phosphotransferase